MTMKLYLRFKKMVEARRNAILYFLLFILGFSVGYFLKPTTTIKPDVIENPSVEAINDQKIPECYAGRCPEYFSMDVDTDDLAESVVIVPTTMSQGAGKIMIIKKGRVIFESDDLMRINVIQTKKQQEEGNGFTILYGKEVNSNVGSEMKFKYQNGQFISEE